MSRRLPSLLCALWLLAAADARAQHKDELFRAGNQAYFEGDFTTAATKYRALVAAGVEDPDVYFNLGTTLARLSRLGEAILYFERARRLAPSDAETQAALATARGVLGKRRAQATGEALIETRPELLVGLVEPYGKHALSVATLVLDLLCFAALVLRRRVAGETLRTSLATFAVLCGLGCATAFAALLVRSGAWGEGRPAIVLRDDLELREGPDPRAAVRTRAPEGASARVLRTDGGYARIRVDRGGEGWAPLRDVGFVSDD